MVKKDNTILWIVGIIAVLIAITQLGNLSNFAIVGGGEGSSITQTIKGTAVQVYEEGEYLGDKVWCVARPPTGETWLITSIDSDNIKARYCYISTSYPIDWVYMTSADTSIAPYYAITDRMFIDNNAYLVCTGQYECDYLTIIGVRV